LFSIENAATELEIKYRQESWLVGIGIARPNIIYIYTKTKPSQDIPGNYEGFSIIVKVVGNVQPAHYSI
jgi:hypothetical protein